jgi:hypothetical protein
MLVTSEQERLLNIEYFEPVSPLKFAEWTTNPLATLRLTSVVTGDAVDLSGPEGICTDGAVQSCYAQHQGGRVRVTNGQLGVTFISEQAAREDYA